MDVSLSELRELVMDRKAWLLQFMGSQRVGHDWTTELNWTEGWEEGVEKLCVWSKFVCGQFLYSLQADYGFSIFKVLL